VGGRRSTKVYGHMSIVAVVAALIVVYEWQFGGFSWLWQQAAGESAPAKLATTEAQKDPVVLAVAEPIESEPPAEKTTAPLVIAPKVSDSTSTTPTPPTPVPQTPQTSPAKLSTLPSGVAPQAVNSARTGPGSTTLPAGVPVAVPGAPVSAVAPRPPASASALPAPAPTGEQRPAGPRARSLALQFERDSWVEIKQANGKVLMSQLNRGGTEQTVEGIPPFEIIIGNAPSVRLTYNNSPIDLRPHLKVDVARLTLE
jgi:cytoskeleton protein RodZ